MMEFLRCSWWYFPSIAATEWASNRLLTNGCSKLMIPCESGYGKMGIYQEGRKSRQHQKSIRARAITSMVNRIRRTVSETLFVAGDGDGTAREALVIAVGLATAVGSCNLFHAICVPSTIVGV